LPDTPERLQRELDLQTHLGPVLIATKGLCGPEVAQTYTRARSSASRWARPLSSSVLSGLRHFYEVQAELQTARGWEQSRPWPKGARPGAARAGPLCARGDL
jgi:hypothetical protein